MEAVYKAMQAEVDGIDFQWGGGCSELNKADPHPCCSYLHFSWLSLAKREEMVDLEYPLVLVSLWKFELSNYVV